MVIFNCESELMARSLDCKSEAIHSRMGISNCESEWLRARQHNKGNLGHERGSHSRMSSAQGSGARWSSSDPLIPRFWRILPISLKSVWDLRIFVVFPPNLSGIVTKMFEKLRFIMFWCYLPKNTVPGVVRVTYAA